MRKAAWIRATLSVVFACCAIVGVSSSVSADVLSASVADETLSSVTFRFTAQNSTGSLTITAADDRNSGADSPGWNVALSASNFVYSGPNAGAAIPSRAFSNTANATPVKTVGTGPTSAIPTATATVGSLNNAVKTMSAAADTGNGTYTQVVSVTLVVPGAAVAGTYTSTLTSTITSGP